MQGPSLWSGYSRGRPFERTAGHGAHQIETKFGVRMHVFKRIDRVCGRVRSGAKYFRAGLLAGKGGFSRRDPARTSFCSSNADTRLDDDPVLHAKGRQSHRDCVIACTTAEFVKAEAGVWRQQRQPRLKQQFIVRERGHHHALEVIIRGDDAAAAQTGGDDFRAERHGGQAPLGCGVGVG